MNSCIQMSNFLSDVNNYSLLRRPQFSTALFSRRAINRTREWQNVENERLRPRRPRRTEPLAGHWLGRISNVEVHYAETVKGLRSGSANPPEGR